MLIISTNKKVSANNPVPTQLNVRGFKAICESVEIKLLLVLYENVYIYAESIFLSLLTRTTEIISCKNGRHSQHIIHTKRDKL